MRFWKKKIHEENAWKDFLGDLKVNRSCIHEIRRSWGWSSRSLVFNGRLWLQVVCPEKLFWTLQLLYLARCLFILSSTIISRWNFHLRKIFEGCWPSIIYEWKAIEVELVSARICVLEPIVFVTESVLVFVVQFFWICISLHLCDVPPSPGPSAVGFCLRVARGKRQAGIMPACKPRMGHFNCLNPERDVPTA